MQHNAGFLMRRSIGLALATAAALAPGAGCGSHGSFVKVDDVALGRVVVYRSGVAYYERRATVEGRTLTVSVPRDKVDDFLKSLTVTDAKTGKALPVSFPRQQSDYGAFLEMSLELPASKSGKTDVVLTYVTEAPAWKPSYRVVVGKSGQVMLEGWAIVDNTSGEDWRKVIVGVGSSSALSFRYDLWSVRTIERETLASEDRFAVAPPTGVSPYHEVTSAPSGAVLADLYDDEIRREPGDAYSVGTSFSGSSGLENNYIVDGVNTTGLTYGSEGDTLRVTESAPMIDSRSAGDWGGFDAGREHTKNLPVARPVEPTGGALERQVPPNRWQMGDAKVNQVAQQIAANRRVVVIEGYANAGEPEPEQNAVDRANVVRNQLIDAGVPPAQLRVVGRGWVDGNAAGVKLVDGGAVPAQEVAASGGGAAAAAGSVSDDPVGESHFQSEKPMTVAKGSSVMVSMVRDSTEGEVVYLYDADSARGNDRFAFRAVRLRNPTDSTLDPGPVTVYGDGRFIGEGLTEPIPPRASVVVPFALDRQVVVERTQDTDNQIAGLLTLQRGVLRAEVQHLRRTHLKLTNRLGKDAKVFIRHTLQAGFELTKAPEKVEKVGIADLFEVSVPAGETRTVEIEESTPIERTLDLGHPAGIAMVQAWLEHSDAEAVFAGKMKELLAVHIDIADTEEKIDNLRQRLQDYRTRMDELHAQIVTLQAVKTGGALMKHLKTKMTDISDRVQQTTIEVVNQEEALMLARIRFQDGLAELTLDKAKGGHAPDSKTAAAAPTK
jgi:hypothetical protein